MICGGLPSVSRAVQISHVLIHFHFSFFVFSHLSMPNKARYFSTYASDVNANGPTAASMSGHSGFAVPICPMNSATISIPP